MHNASRCITLLRTQIQGQRLLYHSSYRLFLLKAFQRHNRKRTGVNNEKNVLDLMIIFIINSFLDELFGL